MTQLFDVSGFFDGVYLESAEECGLHTATICDADAIERLAGPVLDKDVVDIGCGEGRLSRELSRRGARVLGFDTSPAYVDLARQRASSEGSSATFAVHDMSEPWQRVRAYDLTFMWQDTLGYVSDRDYPSVFRNVAAALRPGGHLVLDCTNRDHLAPQLPLVDVQTGAEALIVDHLAFEVERSVVTGDRQYWRPGRERVNASYRIRLFTPPELRRLLEDAGFASIRICSESEEQLTRASRRLRLVASVTGPA